jgi:hypothetical protein
MQCVTIKSVTLSFGIGFSSKYIKHFSFIVEKHDKNTYI